MPLKDLVILHPLKKTIPSGQSKDCLLIFDRPTGKCGDVDFKRYQMIRAQSIRDGTKIPLAGRPKTARKGGAHLAKRRSQFRKARDQAYLSCDAAHFSPVRSCRTRIRWKLTTGSTAKYATEDPAIRD
jgi:hypothetical protein